MLEIRFVCFPRIPRPVQAAGRLLTAIRENCVSRAYVGQELTTQFASTLCEMRKIAKQAVTHPFLVCSSRDAYPYVVDGDGVVGVEDEELDRERRCLAQLRRQQQTCGAEQLQLRFPDRADREEPVHVVHRQGEDLVLALLLLAYLQMRNDRQS